jgi:hypothetical protein
MASGFKSGLDLLLVFDALVKRDRNLSGLKGQIAVGVRMPTGEQWWSVKLDPVAEARFADQRPEADVSLLVDERDADAILDLGALPADRAELKGDTKLLQKFMARYAQKQGVVGVRKGA